MNIYEKLNKARIQLQNMNLKKSGMNKFAGFAYYELSDFIPSVNLIFSELKLYSMFSIEVGEAVLRVINAEAPEEHVLFSSPIATVELKGCTAIQGVGAIHTYMKRYLYMNALEIVEHDALDAKAGSTSANLDADKSIDSISDIKQLNQTYRLLSENIRDTSWKKRLMDKSSMLNAVFDTKNKQFVMAA